MNNSQQLANLIQLRAKEVGKTLLKISEECEISKNFMQSMKKEGYMPRLENLCKLADSLYCSVDYLLGRTDNPKPEVEHTHIEQTHQYIQNDSSPIVFAMPSETQLDENQQELLKRFGQLKYTDKLAFMQELVEKTEGE